MRLVRLRRGLKKDSKDLDAEYGYHYSADLAGVLYWEYVNSGFVAQPEPGGLLDQDAFLIADRTTYGWLVRQANLLLDEEEELTKKAKDAAAARL